MKAFFAHPGDDLPALSASHMVNQTTPAFSAAFVWHKSMPLKMKISLSKIDFGVHVELQFACRLFCDLVFSRDYVINRITHKNGMVCNSLKVSQHKRLCKGTFRII